MKTITIEYYAILREMTGKSQEQFATEVNTVLELYQEVKLKYEFILEFSELRAAINDAFVAWQANLNNGDIVVFIPPISGG